jgi:hypothetical protein
LAGTREPARRPPAWLFALSLTPPGTVQRFFFKSSRYLSMENKTGGAARPYVKLREVLPEKPHVNSIPI